jgi:hypothetical protein
MFLSHPLKLVTFTAGMALPDLLHTCGQNGSYLPLDLWLESETST